MRGAIALFSLSVVIVIASCGPSRGRGSTEEEEVTEDDAGTSTQPVDSGTTTNPRDSGLPATCISAFDCASQQKCYASYCVAKDFCLTPIDCLGGETCVSEIHACRAASFDAGTTTPPNDGGPRDAGSPSACRADWQCPWGSSCVNGTCRADPTDAGTSSHDAGTTSADAGPTCVSDTECALGETCFLGGCYAAAVKADGTPCDVLTCAMGAILGGTSCFSQVDGHQCAGTMCLFAMQSGAATAPCD